REHFRGEDLADMMCYVRLHGELALRAKGVLLLRESGLDELPIDEETPEKLAELAHLERAIGRTGVLALRPLIMASGKDIWQLRLLGRERFESARALARGSPSSSECQRLRSAHRVTLQEVDSHAPRRIHRGVVFHLLGDDLEVQRARK